MWALEHPSRHKDAWCVVSNDIFTHIHNDFIEQYIVKHPEKIIPAKIKENGGSRNGRLRRTDIAFLEETPAFDDIYKRLSSAVTEVNAGYFKFALTHIETLQYSMYRAEDQGFYDIHTDATLKGVNGICRKLSFSIQLNNPNEFEGGNLVFHDSNPGNIVRLKQNQIIFFPSFLPHSVSPVTRGVRKSLVGWVIGPDFV
jgi:PKHD-type hydroxylase